MKLFALKHWMLTLFFFLFVLEIFSVLPHLQTKAPRTPISDPQSEPVFLQGIFNIQSSLSGGPLSIPELAQLAEVRGHDFIILGERTRSEARRQGFEKRYGNTDVFIELEDKTDAGDLFVFYSHTGLINSSTDFILKTGYRRALGDPDPNGLFVSVSHPSHPRNPWTQLGQFPDGIELINFDSALWRRLFSNPIDFLGIGLIYPLNPFLASLRFVQPFSKDLSYWDNMNSLGKPRFALFSSQFKPHVRIHSLDFSLPAVSDVFGLASNVVFLKGPPSSDFDLRKSQIYASIKEARIAIVYQSIFPFQGNDFFVECEGKRFRSGEKLLFNKNCELVVHVPKDFPFDARIKVFRNGKLEAETAADSDIPSRFAISDRGPYRVEIWTRPHSLFWILLRKWVPYIIYSPVFIN